MRGFRVWWFIAATFVGGLTATTAYDDWAEFEKEYKSFQGFCAKTKKYVDTLEREIADKVAKRDDLAKQIREKTYGSYRVRAEFKRISEDVTAFMALRKSVQGIVAEVTEVEKACFRVDTLRATISDADKAVHTATGCLDWLDRGCAQLGIDLDKRVLDIFELTGDQRSAISAFRSLGVPAEDLDKLSYNDRVAFINALKKKLADTRGGLDTPIPTEVEEFFQRDDDPEEDTLLVSSAFMRKANSASVFAKLAEMKKIEVKDFILKATPNKDWKALLESLLDGKTDNLLFNHLIALLS